MPDDPEHSRSRIDDERRRNYPEEFAGDLDPRPTIRTDSAPEDAGIGGSVGIFGVGMVLGTVSLYFAAIVAAALSGMFFVGGFQLFSYIGFCVAWVWAGGEMLSRRPHWLTYPSAALAAAVLNVTCLICVH